MPFCLPQACYEEAVPEPPGQGYGGFAWVPSTQPRLEFAVKASVNPTAFLNAEPGAEDDDGYPQLNIYFGIDLSTTAESKGKNNENQSNIIGTNPV